LYKQDLALLQAEAFACVMELANVPNVCWQFLSTILFILCTVFFFSMAHNGEYKNSSRLRGTFLSSYKNVEAGYNP